MTTSAKRASPIDAEVNRARVLTHVPEGKEMHADLLQRAVPVVCTLEASVDIAHRKFAVILLRDLRIMVEDSAVVWWPDGVCPANEGSS